MLRHFLELHTTLDVVAEASSSEQALAVTATVKPDVVIMDIELPGMNGTSATRELRWRHPEMRALAFSSICDDATREAVKEAGADGFLVLLVNERSPDELAYELQSAKNAPSVTLLSPRRESLVATTRSAFPGRIRALSPTQFRSPSCQRRTGRVAWAS